MGLHEKIQPHHHVATWAVAALAVVLAATINVSNTIAVMVSEETSGPSERTKKFFNFEDSGGQFTTPVICQQPSTEQQAKIDQQNQLSQQMNTLSQTDTSQYTAEQLATHQQKIQTLQAQMSELSASFSTTSFEPSDACKKAIVEQMITQMTAMLSQMKSKLTGTLDRVNATVAKVETAVNNVDETTANNVALDEMKTDISSIKLNVGVLSSFFTKMQGKMEAFLVTAKTDPLKAFIDMQNFGGGGDDGNAAKAADAMVDSFERLQTNMEKLIAEGTQ